MADSRTIPRGDDPDAESERRFSEPAPSGPKANTMTETISGVDGGVEDGDADTDKNVGIDIDDARADADANRDRSCDADATMSLAVGDDDDPEPEADNANANANANTNADSSQSETTDSKTASVSNGAGNGVAIRNASPGGDPVGTNRAKEGPVASTVSRVEGDQKANESPDLTTPIDRAPVDPLKKPQEGSLDLPPQEGPFRGQQEATSATTTTMLAGLAIPTAGGTQATMIGNNATNANHSSNKGVPMVAITCCLIAGFLILGGVGVVYDLDLLFAAALYACVSLLILGTLSIFNLINSTRKTRRPPANQYQIEKFPRDSYSFIAIFGPKDDPDLFCFGIIVFMFQCALFSLMIMSVVREESRTIGEIDNPDSDLTKGFAGFIPANAPRIVRATQIITILSYLVFPEASLMEIAKGVEMFPPFWARDSTGLAWRMKISSVLRCVQGCLAIFAVFLLVMTASDVIEIVLNFTAANLISLLDDTAFQVAMAGKYGPVLEEAAAKVEMETIPQNCIPRNKCRRYRITICILGALLFGMMVFVMFSQESTEKWITRTIFVQFESSADLQQYSGCYDMSLERQSNKRHNYQFFTDDFQLNQTQFGYCNDDRRWVLFNGKTLDGTSIDDPCLAGDNELGYSSKTDLFDISSSFTDPWYSVSNEPLDLFLLDLGHEQNYCSTYQNTSDGICVKFFNTPEYDYDGGDCCASTCAHPDCGKEGLKLAFGTKISQGNGYPNCIDESMKAVIVHLDSVEIDDEVRNPLLQLDCDGKVVFTVPLHLSMVDNNQTVFVTRAANCTLGLDKVNDEVVQYTVSDNTSPLFQGQISNSKKSEYFSVYNLYDDKALSAYVSQALKDEIMLDLSRKNFGGAIPSEIGLLTQLTFLNLFENSFTGTVPSEIGALSRLNSLFLNVNSLSGTIPSEIGLLSNVGGLYLSQNAFSGTVPNEIGLMTKLTYLSLYVNMLTGILPSEIGQLTQLTRLEVFENSFTGTLPSEIGMLQQVNYFNAYGNGFAGTLPREIALMTKLTDLLLHKNNFTGTIPSEIGMLTNSKVLTLSDNAFTGILPSEIGLMTYLNFLFLYNNGLSGTLPTEIGMLTQLMGLYIHGNSFTGTLPSEIGLLTGLIEFYSANNLFTGTVPSEIGLLTKLTQLELIGNSFTGPLPTEILLLPQLSVLLIEDTHLA